MTKSNTHKIIRIVNKIKQFYELIGEPSTVIRIIKILIIINNLFSTNIILKINILITYNTLYIYIYIYIYVQSS